MTRCQASEPIWYAPGPRFIIFTFSYTFKLLPTAVALEATAPTLKTCLTSPPVFFVEPLCLFSGENNLLCFSSQAQVAVPPSPSRPLPGNPAKMKWHLLGEITSAWSLLSQIPHLRRALTSEGTQQHAAITQVPGP